MRAGARFGTLTVTRRIGADLWECRCDCGEVYVRRGGEIAGLRCFCPLSRDRKIDPGFPPSPVSEEAKEAFNDDWMFGDERQVARFYELLI